MNLTMLGTGNALVTECYNTCFILQENNQYFMVDGGGGNTILHQLKHAGIDWKNVKTIFVTHKHIDHITGILWMMRMICQYMRQGEYEGEATIYAHDEVIDLLKDLAEKLLQKKEIGFIGKRLHLIAVKDGEAVNILNKKVTLGCLLYTSDKKFWDDQLDTLGEPLYSDIQGPSVLEEARRRHGNPKLRSSDIEMKDLFVAVKDYYLEPEPTKNLMDFCMNHQLSMTNLLLLGIRTYLSKVNNGQEDITIQNFISRRSTHDEWTSGGSRTIMFPCRTVIAPETDFLSAAYEIQNMQNRIYMHSNYDPAFIMDEMRKRYNTPEHTGYESCYLTYQPMTVKVENEMLGTIRQHAKWFANGAATKKMYLTVSHTEDGGMNFSYHYQTAHLEEHDMELLYYYMMRILFKGIAEPDMSIGEIMELV